GVPERERRESQATSRTPTQFAVAPSQRTQHRTKTGRLHRPQPGPPRPRERKPVMNRSIRRLTAFAVAALVALAVAPVFAADAPSGVVNVNPATAAELDLLPGVGPAVAGRIVEHREKNGAFKTADELMLIKGIGQKTFDKMKPYVALSG